jgi:hypothetical protein
MIFRDEPILLAHQRREVFGRSSDWKLILDMILPVHPCSALKPPRWDRLDIGNFLTKRFCYLGLALRY